LSVGHFIVVFISESHNAILGTKEQQVETQQNQIIWTRQKDIRGKISYTSECGVINRVYETYTTRSIGSRTTYYNFLYDNLVFDTLTEAKNFAESFLLEKVGA
jgi:hypothetical protein